ncbi:hypothetical protein LTR97_010370 [Elasticomyces elasticus]|uniref:Uncharacterized protein n=1 Tax=Elasticomyces elasticus TaxID=574655 RepID=A0AAN7W9H8_9PEZI|nr:hypothetical protein LTR97_010370 [Elasticomyces elasticus]
MSTYKWLVTGASAGLGAQIALAALSAGHSVIATARNVSKARSTYPKIEGLGGSWLELDVTSIETESIIAKAVKEERVNVIVNNAGYALEGPLEALSTAGICPLPSLSAYAASKFALEGMSEALYDELAPFDIRVLLVEPGAYRTDFITALQSNEIMAPYVGTAADNVSRKFRAMHGKQGGDPAKAAIAIIEAVTGEGKGKDVKGHLRLVLGKDAVARVLARTEQFAQNVEGLRHISEWAVFPDGE